MMMMTQHRPPAVEMRLASDSKIIIVHGGIVQLAVDYRLLSSIQFDLSIRPTRAFL